MFNVELRRESAMVYGFASGLFVLTSGMCAGAAGLTFLARLQETSSKREITKLFFHSPISIRFTQPDLFPTIWQGTVRPVSLPVMAIKC